MERSTSEALSSATTLSYPLSDGRRAGQTLGRPMMELNVEMLFAEHGGELVDVVEADAGVDVAEGDM